MLCYQISINYFCLGCYWGKATEFVHRRKLSGRRQVKFLFHKSFTLRRLYTYKSTQRDYVHEIYCLALWQSKFQNYSLPCLITSNNLIIDSKANWSLIGQDNLVLNMMNCAEKFIARLIKFEFTRWFKKRSTLKFTSHHNISIQFNRVFPKWMSLNSANPAKVI